VSKDWTKDDFLRLLVSAKREYEEHLKSLGLKDDISNAVCVGTLGGMVFENENDCPLYIRGITDGWWFVKGRNGIVFIVNVNSSAGESDVLHAGNEVTNTVEQAVAGGLRFLGKVEFPEWLS